MLKVDVYFGTDKYFKARKLLEEALQLDPTYGQAHSYLGYYYYSKLFDYKRAQKHYAMAMKYYPEFVGNYHNFCAVLFEMKNYSMQIQIAKKGTKMPGVDTAWMRQEMGKGFEAMGKLEEAQKHYEAAIEISVCDYTTGVVKASLDRVNKKIKVKMPWYAMLF